MDMPAASVDELVKTLHKTAHSAEKYTFSQYDAIYAIAKDITVLGHTPSQQSTETLIFIIETVEN